jgi:hypothetical protein
VIITVGERSPAIRHESAARLADKFGLSVEVIADAGHAVHLTHPAAFVAVIRRTAAQLGQQERSAARGSPESAVSDQGPAQDGQQLAPARRRGQRGREA